MIQLNLLPDVKLEYIKAQRTQRLMISVSLLVAAAALIILILLLAFDIAQKKNLKDLNKDIGNESSELQHKQDINQILTVQNQLQSLTGLHEGKPAAERLLNDYLNQITPAVVSIDHMHIDFTTQAITINGSADSLASVNKYIDTLKFTTFTTDKDSNSKTKAFDHIVLTSFGVNSGGKGNQAVNYTIDLAYNPGILDGTQKVSLVVPNLITTRSQLDHPTDLFQPAPVNQTNGGE